jgi:hypothetical protein
MKHEQKSHANGYRKKVPLWKWILVLLLVVAMPLYFAYYRMYNLQYVFKHNLPQTNTNAAPPKTLNP